MLLALDRDKTSNLEKIKERANISSELLLIVSLFILLSHFPTKLKRRSRDRRKLQKMTNEFTHTDGCTPPAWKVANELSAEMPLKDKPPRMGVRLPRGIMFGSLPSVSGT
jgi:hypothetical protein